MRADHRPNLPARGIAFCASLLVHGLASAACANTPPSEPVPVQPSTAEAAGTPATPVAPVPLGAAPGGAGWWRDDVFYEVFVRSFADSDGDGVGDLRGLTSKLDLLNDGDPKTTDDLGVDALWLMPIHASPSYHGYDVVDYRSVNKDYGTLADMDALIAAAHKRGVQVIIDFVLNHSAVDHPWFKAAADPKHVDHARFRDFYKWSKSPPDWKRPWDAAPVWHRAQSGDSYYGLFWSGMPDLNLENPAVLAEMIDAMRFWLARGVDGFRLDAVRHLSESAEGVLVDVDGSHAILKEVRASLEKDFPNALLIGEAWSDTDAIAKYAGQGDELHMCFSFGTAGGIMEAVQDGLRLPVQKAMENAERAFADRGFEAPFLTNHDMKRAMRAFGGDEHKAALAAAVLLALPGTPFLYYGEEIGMQGGPSGADEDKRTPMRFDASRPHHGFTTSPRAWREVPERDGVDVASQRNGGLWRRYQELIALRHQQRALAVGTATRPTVTGGGRGAFALLRAFDGERVLFVVNLHTEVAPDFTIDVDGAPAVLLSSAPAKIERTAGTLRVSGLGARSYAFVKLGP
jgi:alpha-amylase